MNKSIFTIIISLTAITILFSCSSAKVQANKDTDNWRYELEAVTTGTQGSYIIKTWTYSQRPETAKEQAKKNAVHGVIFKGFPDNGRIKGQRPLVNLPNADEKHKDFFKQFFKDGGDYMKYVTLADHGAIQAGDRIKVGKEYKIGVLTTVNVSQLRKRLKKEQVIEALGNRF